MTRAYLLEARYAYQRWGSLAKLAQLDSEFGELLPRVSAGGGSWAAGGAAPPQQFDLQTVLRASQAISSEIVLDKFAAANHVDGD